MMENKKVKNKNIEKINVNVDLEKKLLEIEGNNLKLDDNLLDAKARVIGNSEFRQLYLIYNVGQSDHSSEDYTRLVTFLESIGKSKEINLAYIPYKLKETGFELPIIVLDSYMKINISV